MDLADKAGNNIRYEHVLQSVQTVKLVFSKTISFVTGTGSM